MKRKSIFEKKYPQFVKYITDEVTQNNMLANSDLYDRCLNNATSIKYLIEELERHFDSETIRQIILDTIFKYPDELLKVFITAYLNSDETTKSNIDIVSYFNKTVHLGTECLNYIEECGIVANRTYKLLPIKSIEYKYEKIRKGNEYYKQTSLDDLFSKLTLQNKKYVLKFVSTKGFNILDILFENFNYSLNSVLTILEDKHIDENIINETMLTNLGSDNLMLLVCMIIDSSVSYAITEQLKVLTRNSRYSTIKVLIEKNLINNIYYLTEEELLDSEMQVVKDLESKSINLIKRDE